MHAWRPCRKKDIDMLERAERNATKIIQKLKDVSYEMRRRECGLTTPETRRLRGGQIEVFKILKGYENVDRYVFSRIGKRQGHEVTFAKKRCSLDIRKFKISQRTVY